MRSVSVCRLAVFAWVALVFSPRPAAPQTPTPSWSERRISVPPFGTAQAYVPRAPTTHVVLLVSDEDGWTRRTADIARHIAAQSAVVVGVSYADLRRRAVREGGCWYVASDFELISHAAQKTLKLPQYHAPVLVGTGTGAALVYAALANTPAVTFAGAVSLAFCPILPAAVQVCSGDVWSPDYDDRRRANTLPRSTALPKDWHVIQGADDRVCSAASTRQFVGGMPRASVDVVERGGHRIDRASVWFPALDAALRALWTERVPQPPSAQPRTATMREIEDELQRLQLPLEFRWPAQLTALLLFFSGDGGWASLDEAMAEQLVTRGIGVVGVSSLRYFWNEKSPADVASDIRRLVAILSRTGRPVFAGGFSFGAEVVPVSLRLWTPADRRVIAGLVMIAPSTSASFEINPLDWLRRPTPNAATLVAPAVREDGIPALCVAGADEDDTPCPALSDAPAVRVVRLPGSHHFNGEYGVVADAVAQFIQSGRPGGERRP